MSENELSQIVIGLAIEVHRELGPGLLESVYHECLYYELVQHGFKVEKEKPVPVKYKDVAFDIGFRMDLLVEDKLVVELKAVKELHDVHMAQVLSQLKLSNLKLGLLMNFNVALLKDGIKRVVNGL